MNIIEFTYNLRDIDAMAHRVLDHLDTKTILFYGEMGSGKTTFINALLRAMNSSDIATSPTFSIVNEYILPNDKIYHFDFYRIESIEEAYNFGVEDYFNSDHWLFIEWPDRVNDLLPKEAQSITITSVDNSTRSLKLTINNKLLTEQNAMTEPKF
ncbi:tRNA (adenosine(37)-N6)-threonylcarbamoyltransferase complex ATPase subunit type 1 TsaE [Winogradskyella tangerina]|uniref:tRNA (adenosine(37)-N6)-threonylcarbamoyltransferase complex ATPase subunit type 1 TsaE n=1 Tax=Winogradskyella tangerina TaxID=2023240 RepID=UPI000DBE7506|nr:tRNA (adenosine(37)-N6)-threonylcarbamoyltransferase complex ATPase subunit type 1 TsaE [Winogradskyella tangerina]